MNLLRRNLLLAICAALLTYAALVHGQEPKPDRANSQPSFLQAAPSFLVRLGVNHATRTYREGDALELQAVSEVDCFGYIVYHQADGKSFLVFPNSIQKDNRLKARQTVAIPAGGDLFRWQIGAPFGQEKITLICTKEPLDELAAPELRSKRFNRVTKEQLKGIELEIGKEEPTAWGVDEVEITTFARSNEVRDPNHRRVGVFFGVAQYQFNVEAEAVNKGKGLNLATCHRDARQLAKVLKEVGALSETRTFTNEQATKKNFEMAITQWLPAVTRPGDTVVIYFSGHGTKLPDDNSDEADGQDEALVPYDFVSVEILNEAMKRAKDGTLDPLNAQRAVEALEIAKKAGSLDKAAMALARETTVSDDLFGHWLQRLAGRQVIVVLDICFAGGFATEEKNLADAGKPATFDFADSEVSRLKDLGQKELVLLAASSSQTTSAVRREEDLSVMTFFLVQAIQTASGQLTVERAHEFCKSEMQRYFDQWNRAAAAAGKPKMTPHEPQLFNYSTRPVFLIP